MVGGIGVCSYKIWLSVGSLDIDARNEEAGDLISHTDLAYVLALSELHVNSNALIGT